MPVKGQPDSVDLLVITRDVFSLGGSLGGGSPTAPEFSIYDANVSGLGQRVELTGLVDAERDPTFGLAAAYRKSSAFGSLVNVELGYTQLNSGRSYGGETEYAYYLRLSRSLP